MRILLFILALLLSLSVGSRSGYVDADRREAVAGVRNQTSDAARNPAFNRDLCLAAAPSPTFSGGEHGAPVSVRSTNTTHRTNPSTKSTTRMLKAGKDLCVRHFKPFLQAALLAESGRCTAERYLFSLCRLRL